MKTKNVKVNNNKDPIRQTTILKKISLEPVYLSSNYKEHIIQQIHKNMKGSCFKDYGYIIDVLNNIEVGENIEIVNNGNVIFPVKIPCLCFKPEVDMILTGVIELINKDCIRVKKDDLNFVISVPFDKCLDYKYNDKTNSYKNKNSELVKGDKIHVKIDYINYTFKNYTCLAQMVKL